MSTADILVRGRNRRLLFEKLRRGGISVRNVQTLDEKNVVLTVDAKDCEKVFAICGGMWYNKLIKIKGFRGVAAKITKRAALFVGIALFFAACFFSGRLIFSTEIRGASDESLAVIESVLAKSGVKKGAVYSGQTAKQIERDVLSSLENCSFVTVEKRGNRLIIEVFEEQSPQIPAGSKAIVAREDGVVSKIIVYRGEALFAAGDSVKSGDVLIKSVGSGTAMGVVEIRSTFVYEYAVQVFDQTSEIRAVAVARAMCPHGADSEVDSVVTEKTGSGAVITVTLGYIVKYGG